MDGDDCTRVFGLLPYLATYNACQHVIELVSAWYDVFVCTYHRIHCPTALEVSMWK